MEPPRIALDHIGYSKWIKFMAHQTKKIERGATPNDILEIIERNWERLERETNLAHMKKWCCELKLFENEWPIFLKKGVYFFKNGRSVRCIP